MASWTSEKIESRSLWPTDQVVEFHCNFSVGLYLQKAKAGIEVKKELQQQLKTMIKDEETVKEMIIMVKEYMKKNNLPEQEVVIMVSQVPD